MKEKKKSQPSLKDRLKKTRKAIEERKSSGNVFFPKPGTHRFRVLSPGEDQEFAMEMVHFYLGQEIKGVYSPMSIGEPCPIHAAWKELKESDDDDDKALAKSFSPRTKVLIPVFLYEDDRGKKVDKDRGIVLMQVTNDIYGEMIDAFLDPDLGDFTDPDDGYDLKLKRVGSGKTDTTYSLITLRPSKVKEKDFRKEVDLQKMVLDAIPTAEVLNEKFKEFLAEGGGDNDDDEPTRKKTSRKSTKKKKSKGDA